MRDTFRCPNMLLRKSLEAPPHKLRHAHKYKLLTTCPSAVGPVYSEAVSPSSARIRHCREPGLWEGKADH